MTIVILAEKPSVANDIANVLGVKGKHETHWQGDGIVVTLSLIHI